MDLIGGNHIKWSKSGSEKKTVHVFSPMWEINTIQITKWVTLRGGH
jgi:hypothetical protein